MLHLHWGARGSNYDSSILVRVLHTAMGHFSREASHNQLCSVPAGLVRMRNAESADTALSCDVSSCVWCTGEWYCPACTAELSQQGELPEGLDVLPEAAWRTALQDDFTHTADLLGAPSFLTCPCLPYLTLPCCIDWHACSTCDRCF